MLIARLTYHSQFTGYTYSTVKAAGGAEIPIYENGYLFVFVSNESQGNVYFDDLTIQHTSGNLLEEHHYYPTGLEMFALSSSASNGHVRNRYGYQGQERENTFALNLNEFEARHYDPQTGRWMVPDPAQQFPSPYVGMGNQWVSGVDPDGRLAFAAIAPFLIAAGKGAAIASATYVAGNFAYGNTWKDMNFKSWATSAAIGAIGGAFSHGVGNAFMNAKSGFLTEVSKASVHGQFNAIMTGIMGGDPLTGFAAGFGGSLAGAHTQKWGVLGRLGASMTVGGLSAEMAGGDFFKGASIAGVGFMTNQFAHEIIDRKAIELIKAYNAYPGVSSDMPADQVFEALGGGIYDKFLDGTFTNACASRLSLALIKAGVTLPKHFLDANGNGVITSAEKMYTFMTKRYGHFMKQWNGNPNQRGFYIGVTKPGTGYSGHVTKVGPSFSANFYADDMSKMAFWRVPELNYRYSQMIFNNRSYKPL